MGLREKGDMPVPNTDKTPIEDYRSGAKDHKEYPRNNNVKGQCTVTVVFAPS